MSSAPQRLAVLFVCLGNICRSPMADGAMRAEADRLGLDLLVDSAGTGSWHIGNPPDPRAIAAAAWQGVDISGLRARQIETSDHYSFTLILALDAQNQRTTVRLRNHRYGMSVSDSEFRYRDPRRSTRRPG